MWSPKGMHPIVTVIGSHQRTYVFGTLTIDGRQVNFILVWSNTYK